MSTNLDYINERLRQTNQQLMNVGARYSFWTRNATMGSYDVVRIDHAQNDNEDTLLTLDAADTNTVDHATSLADNLCDMELMDFMEWTLTEQQAADMEWDSVPCTEARLRIAGFLALQIVRAFDGA